MAQDTQKKSLRINEFLKDSAKVFVCGDNTKRPQEIMAQPSMKVLSQLDGSRTVYAEADAAVDKTIHVSLDKPMKGGKLESQTQSSKDFRELESTLKELGNCTWVMDKDSILRTFVEEGSSKKAAYKKHMDEFKQESKNEFRMGPRDEQYLYEELMSADKNNPFSAAVPAVSFAGNVGMINPADPDMPIHDMFFPYMKEEKLVGQDEYNKFINLHEAGHANDRRNHRSGGMFEDASDTVWKRHRTECVADTFATLMMARSTGNLEIGKLAADVRNEFTIQGLAYIQSHLDKRRQQENPDAAQELSPNAMMLAKYRDKNFENGDYVGSPELKKYIEKQKNPDVMVEAQEPSFIETIANRFDASEKTSINKYGQSVEDVLGSIFAYTTTPTVDATLKVADEKLKDGSLQKMTTKDLYSLAEKMVDENTYSKDQLSKMISSFVKGEPTPEIAKITERRESSALVKAKGQVKAGAMNKKEVEAYDAEFSAKLGKDINPTKVMDAVEQEKDALRAVSPFRPEYKYVHAKITHLNKKYIDQSAKLFAAKEEKTAKIVANKDKYKQKKSSGSKVNPALLNKGKGR